MRLRALRDWAEDHLVVAGTLLVLMPMWGAIFIAISIGRVRKLARWLST